MLVVVVMLKITARKKMYGTALSGICLCLLEIKSIVKLIYVKILAEICYECVSLLDIFGNILKQTRKFIPFFMKILPNINKKEYLK